MLKAAGWIATLAAGAAVPFAAHSIEIDAVMVGVVGFCLVWGGTLIAFMVRHAERLDSLSRSTVASIEEIKALLKRGTHQFDRYDEELDRVWEAIHRSEGEIETQKRVCALRHNSGDD